VWSMEYCIGLFVWGLEVCAHLVVGGVCVAEVHGGGLRCWGLCVFVIKSLCRLWVFSVVVRLDRLDSGTTHTLFIFSHSLHCRKLYAATQHLMLLMMGMYLKYVELRIC